MTKKLGDRGYLLFSKVTFHMDHTLLTLGTCESTRLGRPIFSVLHSYLCNINLVSEPCNVVSIVLLCAQEIT